MGQRLVITIRENVNAEPLAAVYLHWSAYTVSAYLEAGHLLWSLSDKKCKTKEEWQKAIVTTYLGQYFSEKYQNSFPDAKGKHGGVCQEDRMAAECLWPDLDLDMDNIHRNLGLVAITPEQIGEMLKDADGTASIHLDTLTADIDIFFDSPASGWSKKDDGNWYYGDPSCDDEYAPAIPDHVWKNLTEIQTSDLSVSDIKSFLEQDAKKVEQDGWALADDGRTVIQLWL